MVNPVNDIIGGMMQGAALGNMLRQAAIQQDEVKRRQIEFAQDQELEDYRRRDLIGKYTRPVDGGMVSEERDASMPVFDYQNPGKPKFEMRKTTLKRPVDKSRLAKFKLSDGTEISGEMLTPEEQRKREFTQSIEEAREKGRLASLLQTEQAGQIQRLKDEHDARVLNDTGIPLDNFIAQTLGIPAGRKVSPSQIDEMGRAAASLMNAKSLATQRSQPKSEEYNAPHFITDDEGNVTQVMTTKSGTTTTKRLGKLGKGKGEMSEYQQISTDLAKERLEEQKRKNAEAASASEQKARDRLKSEHDNLNAQTEQLWAQHQKIAQAWNDNNDVWDFDQKQKEPYQVKDAKRRPVSGYSDANRNRVKASLESLRKQIEGVESKKKEVLARLRRRESGAAGAGAANPKDPAGIL